MLVASVLSEITDVITSAIGDYGLYAVFLLMLIDAVLPANEAVMLYAGALAAARALSAAAHDQERESLRRRLHARLSRLLDYCRTYTDKGSTEIHPLREVIALQRWMRTWRQDPVLAPVREPEILAKLPANEREEWETLWRDVDELQRTTRSAKR